MIIVDLSYDSDQPTLQITKSKSNLWGSSWKSLTTCSWDFIPKQRQTVAVSREKCSWGPNQEMEKYKIWLSFGALDESSMQGDSEGEKGKAADTNFKYSNSWDLGVSCWNDGERTFGCQGSHSWAKSPTTFWGGYYFYYCREFWRNLRICLEPTKSKQATVFFASCNGLRKLPTRPPFLANFSLAFWVSQKRRHPLW